MTDIRHVKVLSGSGEILKEFDGFGELKKGDRFSVNDLPDQIWIALSAPRQFSSNDPTMGVEAIKE